VKSVYPGSIKVGDLVYDEATDKFQRVVATGGEQGSGPRPSRAWVAYEGNPRIAELDLNEHYIVKRAADADARAAAMTAGRFPPHEDDEEVVVDAQTFPVVCQAWLESERGWGCRPDGYTVHLSMADHREWIKHQEANLPTQVPDEYSRPAGEPFLHEVSSEIHNELLEAKARNARGITVLQCNAARLKIPSKR
jgi:hypothetical protein